MVHVLCFGNLLHGDDGFGIHVHRLLAARPVAGVAKLVEAGTRGMDALGMLDRPSQVILVDAIDDPMSPPGTVRVVGGDELSTDPVGLVHGGGVGWLVQAVRASIRPLPRVTLVGAVVGEVRSFVPHLSPHIADRLDEVAALVEALVHGERSWIRTRSSGTCDRRWQTCAHRWLPRKTIYTR